MERQPFPQAHAFLVICLFKQMQARNTCLLKTHVYNNNVWLVGWGLTALQHKITFEFFMHHYNANKTDLKVIVSVQVSQTRHW